MKQGETYVNGRNGINTSNPYSRNYDFDQNLNTFIPGMHEDAQGVVSNDDVVNETPVIGFLYSISRKAKLTF
jgi:hypothetical protein